MAKSSSSSSSSSSGSSSSSDDDDERRDGDDEVPRRQKAARDMLGDDTSDDDDETTARRAKRGGSSSSLKINKAFAARFEHNERRKEVHRLQAKLEREYATKALGATTSDGDDDGSDESDSSATDSDEEEELEQAFDATFADALAKIRRRDPSIYDEKTKLFEDDDEEKATTTKTKVEKKKKKATLREVTATQLLEGGATALEDAEEEAARGVDAGPTYVEEQAALKRAFKDAVEGSDEEDDDDDDGGLVVKTRAEKMVADAAATEKLSEYFNARAEETGGGELSAEDKFLREYLMEKKWLKDDEKTTLKFKKSSGSSSSSSSSGDDDDDGGDSESDSELLQRADEFEHKYNFRFEEPGADQIVSHSRHIEGLVRKQDTRRKDKRRETKERKESERAKLLAEVRRLKNLKRDEINSKMKQISSIGGIKDTHGALSTADFTTEFDPEAHDKVMQQMYGDEYYEQGEDDADALEKPEFGDLEEELAMVLKNKGDNPLKGESTDKGFEALRKNVEGKSKEFLASLAGNAIDDDDDADDDENDDNNNDDDDGNGDDNKFSKRASKRWRKELMAKMDEYYNLDAEDFIGDLPVRFAYKEVAPKMFGLTTKDVLTMDDKSLNQIVGLKKLAPYRDDANDATVDANQRARAQRMAREFLAKSKETRKTSKKKKSSSIGDQDDDEDEEEAERAMREKSYADAAFGKKKSSSSKKRAADDADEALEKKGGKNARKNAKKRAKKKQLLADEQLKQ